MGAAQTGETSWQNHGDSQRYLASTTPEQKSPDLRPAGTDNRGAHWACLHVCLLPSSRTARPWAAQPALKRSSGSSLSSSRGRRVTGSSTTARRTWWPIRATPGAGLGVGGWTVALVKGPSMRRSIDGHSCFASGEQCRVMDAAEIGVASRSKSSWLWPGRQAGTNADMLEQAACPLLLNMHPPAVPKSCWGTHRADAALAAAC